jgi:hypothetical protein
MKSSRTCRNATVDRRAHRNETAFPVFNPRMNGPRQSFLPRRRTMRFVRAAGLLGAGMVGVALARAVAPEVTVTPASTNASITAKASPADAPASPATAKSASRKENASPPAPKTPSPKDAKAADAADSPSAMAKPAGPPVPDKTPYLSIARRNPFGLKDPPPPKPPPPEPEPEVTPSALKLTGISTLLGGKHALFVLQEKGKKPVYSGLVAEGDTDTMIAGLQVIAIDPKAGSVRVNYGGSELLLDFENNGIEPPKASLARKGKPGVSASAVRRTVTRPGGATRSAQFRSSGASPGYRTGSRSSGYRGSAGSRNFRTPASFGRSGGGSYSVPPRTTRSTSRSSSAAEPRRLSPAEQAIVLRVQQEEAQRAGIPLPPPPPVPGMNTGDSAVPPK